MTDYTPGVEYKGHYIIRNVSFRETVHRSPYTTFDAVSGVYSLPCKKWGEHLAVENGQVAELVLRAEEYMGKMQFIVQSIKPSDIPAIDLVRSIDGADKENLWTSLMLYVDEIRDEGIRGFVTTALDNVQDEFMNAPASKTYHHAYGGGLLVHTYEVVRLVDNIAKVFNVNLYGPPIDMGVLYAGAILHDIGKVWSYNLIDADQTNLERLLGHIAMAVSYIDSPLLDGFDDVHPSKLNRIIHCILSHHGSLEWGSPVVPKTPEAIIIHYADMLSSRMAMVEEALISGLEDGWTEYIRPLGTQVYIGD